MFCTTNWKGWFVYQLIDCIFLLLLECYFIFFNRVISSRHVFEKRRKKNIGREELNVNPSLDRSYRPSLILINHTSIFNIKILTFILIQLCFMLVQFSPFSCTCNCGNSTESPFTNYLIIAIRFPPVACGYSECCPRVP